MLNCLHGGLMVRKMHDELLSYNRELFFLT